MWLGYDRTCSLIWFVWHIRLWPYAWFAEAYNANISFSRLGLWHSMNKHTSWLGSFNISFLLCVFSDLGFRWWRKPKSFTEVVWKDQKSWGATDKVLLILPTGEVWRHVICLIKNALFHYAHAFAYVITLSFFCPITNRKRAWSCKVTKRHAELLRCTVVSWR